MANSGINHIEFINDGFKQILASDGCRQVVEETTQEIADKANDRNARGRTGFDSKVVFGSRAGRYVGFVHTTDNNSEIAESEDGALTGAVYGN